MSRHPSSLPPLRPASRRRRGFSLGGLAAAVLCVTLSGLLWAGSAAAGRHGSALRARAADLSASAAGRPVTKAIEDVRVGDWVLAKDPGDPGPPTPHRVVALPRNWTQHVVHVRVAGGGELQATRGHPFWVDGRGWTDAVALRAGDRLRDDRGRAVAVASVSVEARTCGTYNLTVEGVHTYYALAGGVPVLVHNVDFPPMAPGPGRGLGAKAPDFISPTGQPDHTRDYTDPGSSIKGTETRHDGPGPNTGDPCP